MQDREKVAALLGELQRRKDEGFDFRICFIGTDADGKGNSCHHTRFGDDGHLVDDDTPRICEGNCYERSGAT